MVIHDENELPVEVAVIKKPLFEQDSFNFATKQTKQTTNKSKLQQESENLINSDKISEEKSKIKRKRSKLTHGESISSENDEKSNNLNEISADDLEELRTVYKKCKDVMKKIETKYGHLLDLSDEGPSRKHRKSSIVEKSDCNCTFNKKIVFDEDGKEVTIDNDVPCDNDLCPKRFKPVYTPPVEPNVQIEYYNDDPELPESLHELTSMLKNTEMEITLRNKLVNRARTLKQDYLNDIKFHKHSLIEKLKTNPDEILEFKGTNLSTIPGYS